MINIAKQGRWGVFQSPPPKKLENALFNHLAYLREGWEIAVKRGYMNIFGAWVRLYNKKHHAFPWGLASKVVKILEQWKEQYGEDYTFINIWYEKVQGTNFKGLRPYQMKAVKALIDNNGGILSMPTGSGKTITAIGFLKNIDYKACLVVVHTKDLRQQWESENIKKTVIVTYQSLKNHIDEVKKYDVIIFDECHHVSANVLYKIAMNCGKAILVGLSATPFRNYAPETMKIIAALGEIVYKINIRDLIKQGYLCDAEIRICSYINSSVGIFDDYQDIINNCIVNCSNRNDAIVECVADAPKPCLVLVDRVEHGTILFQNLLTKCDNIIFVHGGSKNRKPIFDNVKKGLYDVIIASKIYGEGVDFPNLKSLIIAGGGKSSVAIVQRMGRLLRVFPNKSKAIIYDFEDKVKFLKHHFKQRLEIYEENFEVSFNDWG